MDYPFLFKGFKVPGHTVVNDNRLTTALRKQYSDDDIVPVLLTIQLTHFLERGDMTWMSCAERDDIDGNKITYADIYGELVLPCYTDENNEPAAFITAEPAMIYPIDLERHLEFFFESTTADLTVKILKTGAELRANRGQGRRLHSLCPEAVHLHSFAYI